MSSEQSLLSPQQAGDTVATATPSWLPKPRPGQGAPNIVVVVLDDMGWSDLGCFGSEIATPTIDGLAGAGVRMANFHVTPLCSPTRASLLTGRNHHSVGMRFLAVSDTGYDNSRGRLPDGIATIPGMLRDHGYGTYLAGKWHLAPQEELTPVGPYQNWPLSRGFDRFYGFLGGASDQYVPELYRDNSPVAPSTDPDYHLSSDLVDRSIDYLSDHRTFRPNDPFFLQLAFGATHAPFQAPRESIDRYRGRYDAGWDHLREERLERQKSLGLVPADTRLTERDAAVPGWDDLSADDRRIAARGQEAFAGFLDHADAQLGRLVEWLREAGQLDNTLFAVFSDNGAAGDGGELGTTNVVGPYNNLRLSQEQELAGLDSIGDRAHPAHYAMGWAMAGNTPFRLYKQYVDLGGVRSPLIIHWPDRVTEPGEILDQYTHVIDLAASLLDSAIGREEPDRDTLFDGLHGKTFLPVLDDPAAPGPRKTQHYEMLGHRAIWHDGWKATTRHIPGDDYGDDRWRLYDTTADFSESVDLADSHPEELAAMQELWWTEAREAGVTPLDDRSLKEMLGVGAPGAARPLASLRLRPGQSHLGFTTRLTGTERSMTVDAELTGRSDGEDGVLLASGASYGGYTFYLLGNTLEFEHLFLGERVRCTADREVPAGDSRVGFVLLRTEGRSAEVTLLAGGVESGRVVIPTTSMQLAFYGLDVGRDPGDQVSARYRDRGEFAFAPGVLREVSISFAEASESPALLAHRVEANQ